jgi:FAD/FMN-containing dehydrogenase
MPTIDDLRSTQSVVLTPDDPGFAEATRLPGPPVRPDVYVRPATPEEVGSALRWAAVEGVEVAVRSGGHGIWVPVPGGLLVDLGGFTRVVVGDDDVVAVGAGALWGDVADVLAPHGLALSSGDNRSVGVGGNALGAGLGWLVRSVGLAVDQLVSAEVVTADGRVVTASADENPDLFFAIRGGGGNFGVATRLDLRASRVPDVVFGTAPIDPARLASAVCGVRDAMRSAPRELGVTVVKPPPLGPPMPPMVSVVWAGGDEDAARAALAPLLAVEGVGEADLRVLPYGATLAPAPPMPPGPPPRMAGTNGLFAQLPDATVELAASTLDAHPESMFEVRFLGGALADVAADETALAWRDAEAIVHWIAFLPPDASDAQVEAVRSAWAPVGDGAELVCGTFTDDTGPEVVERMYPPATLARLREVKRTWDPGNLFRRNHNILPA